MSGAAAGPLRLGAVLCLGAGLAALWSAREARGNGERRASGPRVIDVAPGELPEPGAIRAVAAGTLGLSRRGDGALRALRLSCPFLPCPLVWRPERGVFACLCHGDRFGPDGAVLDGPAPTHLERFPVEPAPGASAPAFRIDRGVPLRMVGRAIPPDAQYPDSARSMARGGG
jgi:nitrite reductase/ring-hydroxylating ferredoxin subunit